MPETLDGFEPSVLDQFEMTPATQQVGQSLDAFETETETFPGVVIPPSYSPRPHISHSQITSYMRCPMVTYWRYEKGVQVAPVSALSFGSCIHKALEHNYKQKIYSRTDVPDSVVKDVFRDAWREAAKETVFDAERDENPDMFLDIGIQMLEKYQAEIAPNIQPKAVEVRFKILLPGVPREVLGFIDLIDEDETVIDHKTSRMVPNAMTLGKDLQLTLYRIAYRIKFGHNPKRLRYDYLVRKHSKRTGSWAEIHPVPVERNDAHEKNLIETYKTVCKAVKMKYFYPIGTNFTCAPSSCGFWPMCMGKILENKNLDFMDDIREMQSKAMKAFLEEEAKP